MSQGPHASPVPTNRSLHVRLLMRLEAPSVAEAVDAFIDQTNELGLRNFMYRVTDTETNESWLVQDGVVMSEDEALTRAAEEEDDEEDDDDDGDQG